MIIVMHSVSIFLCKQQRICLSSAACWQRCEKKIMAQVSGSSGRRSQALGSPTSSGSCNCHSLHPLVIITIIINIIGRACKKMDFGGQSTLDPLPCYDPFPTIVIIVCHHYHQISKKIIVILFRVLTSSSFTSTSRTSSSPWTGWIIHKMFKIIRNNRTSQSKIFAIIIIIIIIIIIELHNPQNVCDHQE